MPIPQKDNQLTRVSARQFVYNELKKWIIDGTMLPGEFINDSEIAKHFAVSRTPVREAILMLARQDLVKIIPSKGTQVTPVSPAQAQSVFEAIGCLAKEIAVLATEKHTAGNILELRKLNDNFRKAVMNNGDTRYADRLFHDCILKIAHNEYLESCWQQLVPHAYRYEKLYYKTGFDKLPSVACHEEIINAIEANEAVKAAALAKDNWTGFFHNNIRPRLEEEKEINDFLLHHKYY